MITNIRHFSIRNTSVNEYKYPSLWYQEYIFSFCSLIVAS